MALSRESARARTRTLILNQWVGFCCDGFGFSLAIYWKCFSLFRIVCECACRDAHFACAYAYACWAVLPLDFPRPLQSTLCVSYLINTKTKRLVQVAHKYALSFILHKKFKTRSLVFFFFFFFLLLQFARPFRQNPQQHEFENVERNKTPILISYCTLQ